MNRALLVTGQEPTNNDLVWDEPRDLASRPGTI